ncbi:hypothetical protein [Streptomyces sp. CB03238]|uniref:hypothetical protein n=1 Tax=Streptomyces sp. CB03238 TaxID=1907777 RepID=UPI000A120C46|nr:hypothetical protein [Streptomyces sp. CB03238]ORT54856.1 hypothetical protein BKD26_33840 [Streptomyces sp. CB03238]
MADIKLSLFSNNFPDHFIIDRDGDVGIAEIADDADRRNATFTWTGPNLRIGETGRLLRAVAPLGICLHIATFDGFRIQSKFFEGIEDPEVAAQVREESTFVLERAEIDPNHATFRSVKFPELVIRHRDFKLFAETVTTPAELQSACFRFAPPLHSSES